jgi:hypothetical protein
MYLFVLIESNAYVHIGERMKEQLTQKTTQTKNSIRTQGMCLQWRAEHSKITTATNGPNQLAR